MTGLDELVDTADSPHQGASACQDCGVYISQIQNTSLPLTIESNTDCSSDVINPIPMMPMIRTDIASLPTEILLHIFKLYYLHYSDAFPKGTVKDLQCWPILGVCSRWRQIVIGTPYFWQRLWTHWHPEIITLFEVRSKSYPLTIQRSSSGGFLLEFPSCDSEGNAVAARLIAAHSSRIRTLRLEWMDWYPETHETKYEFMRRCLADATFPELTQVLLRSVNHYMAMRSMKLNAPKLEVLTLRNLVLDSTSYPHLANLTHLTHIASDLTVQDIVSLLEACPQLESCDIRTRTLETPLLLPEQPHRVPLRALEYINISGLYWPSLARLLDRLEICQTANINLEIEPGERHDPHPLDVFRRIITPLISSYDSLEISGRGIKLIRSTERGSLNFEPDNSKYSVFAHFSVKLAYFSLPNVGIHLSSISVANISPHQLPNIVDIWSAFSGLPNIEVLCLRECKNINNFLKAFQYDATAVICPRLRRVDLHDCYYEREVLLEFVQDRHTKDSLASIE